MGPAPHHETLLQPQCVSCFSHQHALRGRLKVSWGTMLLEEKGFPLWSWDGHRVFHKAVISDTESGSGHELFMGTPVLLPRPTAVHMCLSLGSGISPNAWLWGTDTSWATRPPAASSLLPPHRHLSRGHFPPLRWQRRFRHCPSLCKPRHRSPTLRAAAVPSVGVTAKTP